MTDEGSSTSCMTRGRQERWWRELVARTREQGATPARFEASGSLQTACKERDEDESEGVRRGDGITCDRRRRPLIVVTRALYQDFRLYTC